MPRFDGTGPVGQGPMTGKGVGSCGGSTGFFGRLGFGHRAAGQGFGPGGRQAGRGLRCLNWFGSANVTPADEKTALKEDIQYTEEYLKEAKKHLSDFDKK